MLLIVLRKLVIPPIILSQLSSGNIELIVKASWHASPRNRNAGRTQLIRGSREGNRLRTVPVDDRCHTFVYNLHKKCTALEIEVYIREVSDSYVLDVIKPQLNRTDNSRVFVSCNSRHQNCLLDAITWEAIVRARPYRPPRNAETTASK